MPKLPNYITKKLLTLENRITIATAGRGATGALRQWRKASDYVFGGVDLKPSLFAQCNITPDLWIFDQEDWTICIFASFVMAMSYQEGRRYSVKFMVKMARRLKKMHGEGWSWLRAPADIATQYGLLLYEDMPDELNGQTWEEYSKDDITEEQLKKAALNKVPHYQRVKNVEDAMSALRAGYVLTTANDWYTGMNYPAAPLFLLERTGDYVCGHAWCVSRQDQERAAYVNPQTLGVVYGDRGKAYVRDLFAEGHYDVYMMEKLPNRTDKDRFLDVYAGRCVKGTSSSVYLIENGIKRGFKNPEAYAKVNTQIYSIPDALLAQVLDGELLT